MSSFKSPLRWLPLVASGLVINFAAPSFAFGQEAQDTLEEIVVYGIRNSVREALNIKRDSTNFVDAISAEEVGKLPDANIAEALQRVAGVAIQRNRGEGDFVSIRGLGPNFVRSTLNGRTMLSATEYRSATTNGGVDYSTGREVNFDVLPSEIIDTIEVVKSPSAEHVEGGIGGVVNVHTQRPLSLGTQLVGAAKGIYRQFNGEIDPALTALYSRAINDQFGFLGTVSYSRRSIREDNNNGYGYCTASNWCPPAPIDANGDGMGELTGFALPSASLPEVFQEQRERLTLQSTLQWQFGGGQELVAEVLYSERNIDNLGNIASTDCCGPSGPASFVTNPDGSRRFAASVNNGDTLTSFPLSSSISANSDQQDIDDSLLSLGLNYGTIVADWSIDADVALSQAEGYLNFQRVSAATLEKALFDVMLDDDQVNVALSPGGFDLSDISNYRTNNADAVERFNDDSELSFGVDAGYANWLKIGARYRTRSKDVADRTTFNVNTDKFPLAGSGVSTFHVDNFLDGGGTFAFEKVPFPDVASQRSFIVANNPQASFESVYKPSESYGIVERTMALYAQIDLERTIGNIPVTGNVGVRAVKTYTDVTGFFQPFRIENDETNPNNLGSIEFLSEEISEDTISNDYIDVLPSLNLRFELQDDVFVRLALNKSLTRPTFKQSSPGLNVANPTNRIANAGNPRLVAYDALNFDLGIEWYLGDGSAVYLGAFRKDIDEFIGTATTSSPPATPESDGDGDGIPDGLASGVEFFGVGFASVSQPLNQGAAEITGLEAGYQHAFDNGLGYILNATVVDSSAEFVSGAKKGEQIPFEGVSDRSFNLTGYYENQRYQARLAYSSRSDFVVLSSDVFGNTLYFDGYSQLDASLSYSINEDLRVFVSGLNLTNEDAKMYSDSGDRPVSLSHVGTRLEFGIRASF